MTAPTELTFIPDIVEEHYDELQFLWSQRRGALRSPSYREREILLLEERIEARIEGMLVIGDRIAHVIEPGLTTDHEMPAFAAALVLLRLGSPDLLARVGRAFEAARGKKLDGLRDALASAPGAPLTAQLTSLFLAAPPAVAAAAGEALVFHGALSPSAHQLERFMLSDVPAARAAGWRIAGYGGTTMPVDWYEAAVHDDDVGVKRAALDAAAWNASPVFVAYCRAVAAKLTANAVEVLATFAAVAPPEEYQLIAAIAAADAAGPERLKVVGSFAHPYFIDLLIREMGSSDPAVAAAAGAAFTKMTGRDVDSDTRAKVSPDGKPPANDFEAEFQDEVFLPDPELARRHWQELAPRLASSPRICRGMDVSRPLAREQFAALDMESRSEYCLRARLFSGWQGTPLVLEKYPQRF